MFGRIMMALAISPGYGFLVALSVFPITFIGVFGLAMFGGLAILVPLLLLLAAFIVQVAIFVQSARFAGNYTGLKNFQQQPDFFVAAGRGLMISVLGQILLGLAFAAVTVIFLEYRGGEAIWWLYPGKLWEALQKVMEKPDQIGSIFTFDGFDIDGLLMVMRAVYMVFMTVIAIFIVPLACGIARGTDRAYTVDLIVVRFVLAMPLMAAIAGLVSHFGVLGADLGLSLAWPDTSVPTYVRFGLELTLFAGMIFSFEALLLKAGIAQAGAEDAVRNAIINSGTEDIRALRQSRMDE